MSSLITKVIKLDVKSFAVLQVMNELEQVEGDQVFETRAGSGNQAGIPEIDFGHLLKASDEARR